MTPQEKAVDLFNKMKGFRVKHTHSKRCAKIAVEEILNAQTEVYGSVRVQNGTVFNQFWIEVRQEIEKL